MRRLRLLPSVLTLAGALLVGACGGSDHSAGGDTAQASAAGGGSTSATTPAPAGGAPSAGAAMAATGQTVHVRMIGDAQGYRFEPANVTVHAGDAVEWANASGGPHNVTFWADSIPAGAQAQLAPNMPNATAPLAGPLLTDPNATYAVSFAGLKPGVYHYYCTPHLALGMKATVTVQ